MVDRKAGAPTLANAPLSIAGVMRLLTPENRALLACIREQRPASVSALAAMTGRAPPNVTRTLAKLEAAGFIAMKQNGRRKAPLAIVERFMVEIDPYSDRDRIRVAKKAMGGGA